MTIVLRQYPTSPFAELLRTAMGFKNLDYRSVTIPQIMPKPDLVALTGGYARTPVLQIGADIYCDTAAILDALERLHPAPSFYPEPLGPLHRMLANWAGAAQFTAHVGAAMGELPPGALPQAFIDDRKTRFGLDMAQLARATPHLSSQALTAAVWLDQALADGRAFAGGNAPGHADLAFYSNIWFVKRQAANTGTGRAIAALPHLAAWYERVAAFGHGRPVEATGAEAIEIARAATPDLRESVEPGGFAAGQAVQIKTDNSGDAAVAGRLLRLSPAGIALSREIDGGGTVAVNFPRLGQMVLPG